MDRGRRCAGVAAMKQATADAKIVSK